MQHMKNVLLPKPHMEPKRFPAKTRDSFVGESEIDRKSKVNVHQSIRLFTRGGGSTPTPKPSVIPPFSPHRDVSEIYFFNQAVKRRFSGVNGNAGKGIKVRNVHSYSSDCPCKALCQGLVM